MDVFGTQRWLAASAILALGCESLTSGELNDGPAVDIVVSSATDVGAVAMPDAVEGRTVARTVEFAGRVAWLFADTQLDRADEDGRELHSNSLSTTTDRDATDGIDGLTQSVDSAGTPRRFIPLTKAEAAFNAAHQDAACSSLPCNTRWAIWPGAAVRDPLGNRVLVFYRKLRIGPGATSVEPTGSSIATWDTFDDPATRVAVDGGLEPTLLFAADEPWFGAGAIVVGETAFVYGVDTQDPDRPCVIARVAIDDILSRDAWQFLNEDDEWGSDLAEAVPRFGANDAIDVSFNSAYGTYMAVYSAPDDNRVVFRTSPAPEGPWSREADLFTARAPQGQAAFVDDALAHPELARDEGRDIYVTYSRATDTTRRETRLVHVRFQSPDVGGDE